MEQVEGFLAAFAPAIETDLRVARAWLRRQSETGFELVFDNYNALVFALSPTESSARAFLSVAGYPRWVTLFFGDGATLHDPAGLLQGKGKAIRSIRLTDVSLLEDPGVLDLVDQALERHREALEAAPPLSTVVKTAVANPRSRR